MAYTVDIANQMDGSPFQRENCTWACATMAMDRHSVGRYRLSPAVLRAKSDDIYGGSTYYQNARTVQAATGDQVRLEPRYGLTRDQVRDYCAAGHAFSISIDTNVTAGTIRATGTFRGGHSVFVHGYYWRKAQTGACSCDKRSTLAHAEYAVKDPGRTTVGFQRWSADLLYRAAEARGGGAINVLLTRDTEGVVRVAVENGSVRAKPDEASAKLAGFTPGAKFTVVQTLRGMVVREPDGLYRNGWHKVRRGTGYAYVKGRAIQ